MDNYAEPVWIFEKEIGIRMSVDIICFLKNLVVICSACIPVIIGFVLDIFYETNGVGLLIGGIITMTLFLFAIDKTKRDAKDFYNKRYEPRRNE